MQLLVMEHVHGYIVQCICLITIYQYDYQHNTTISVQQFTFKTTVTRHSLGLDHEVRLI